MIDFVLLAVGILLLVAGADKLIFSASHIARRFQISEFVIGISLVAMGTSMPEFTITMISALSGHPEIAVSNVIGSNIANTLLVIGSIALFHKVAVEKQVVKRELVFNFVASILVGVMLFDHVLEKSSDQVLGRVDGILLLTYFGLFLFYLLFRSSKNKKSLFHKATHSKKKPKLSTWLGVVAGALAVGAGGYLTVESAVGISETFGLSETFVGGFMIAFGTSLPELTTSFVAIRKNRTQLAIGNIIGSNLFNILGILGTAAIITPLTVSSRITVDVLFMILASLMLFYFIYNGRPEHNITKKEGLALLATYGFFVYFAFSF